MNIKNVILSGLTILGLSAVNSVNAAIIALQTFDDDQSFNTGGQTSWTDGLGDTRFTYTGTGLGFVGASKANPVGIQTTVGTLRAGHMSASSPWSSGFQATGNTGYDASNKYTPPSDITFNNAMSGFALFDVVDLSGYDSSTLTLDLTTSLAAFQGNDDAMFVRLYLDESSTGIDVLKMYNNAHTTVLGANTTYVGGTITYTFDDAVNSVELIIGFAVDDSPDYYIIDNVSFQGTAAVPEPSSTTLLALGGLALIRRRKRRA